MGNAMVVVSCEGYEEETDRWRGPGVYKKIMEAMEKPREAHVLFGSSATVTENNVDVVSSEEWIDHLLKKGIIAQMYFLYIPVNGQGDINLMVTPEQRNHLRKQVIKFRRTNRSSSSISGMTGHMFGDVLPEGGDISISMRMGMWSPVSTPISL